MSHEPERYEMFAVPSHEFHLARHDFLQTLGDGLFFVLLSPPRCAWSWATPT